MKIKMLCGLAFHPQLLLLDEPFGGIDVATRETLVEGLLEMTGREGWTVLLSSHDVDSAERLADVVGYIDRGRLVLSEGIDRLRARFREIHVVPRGAGNRTRAIPGNLVERRGRRTAAPLRRCRARSGRFRGGDPGPATGGPSPGVPADVAAIDPRCTRPTRPTNPQA